MYEEKLNIVLPEWEMLADIGLYMDQVITLIERTFSPALPKGEMTKSMVNNYVKVGLIPRPTGKKYEREHLALLLMICILKQALSMEAVAKLLDALCAEGVKAGYERFLAQAGEIEAAAREGRLEIATGVRVPQDQALRFGITAALCTIRTCRLLGVGTGSEKKDRGMGA